MDISDESYRTISTRGVTLTEDQMANYRIKKVYNSFGDPNFINASHAEILLDNFNKAGEFCLLETSNDGKIYIISLLAFEDVWSRNIFAIVHWNYYKGFPDLIPLYN